MQTGDVDRPWSIDDTGTVLKVDEPLPTFVAGDWSAVESHLGVSLPRDYRELVGDGLGLVFDEELVIASPFDDHRYSNLIWRVRSGSWTLAYLRASTGGRSPIFPEAGGLFNWGVDGGGGEYYWDTSFDDPDRWPVVLGDGSIDDVRSTGLGLVAYLDALGRGDAEAAGLDEWPNSTELRRRQPR